MNPNVLIVVLSCLKHRHLWPEILNRDIDNLIIITGKEMDPAINFQFKNKILYLNCNDGYEGLPEKMICAISAILEIDEFKDYTHIIKVDDHDNKFDKSLVQKLKTNPDISAINNKGEFKYDYLGQRLHSYIIRDWHIGKCSPGSPWNTKAYQGPNTLYLDGGSSYLLSRRAMNVISNQYSFSNLEEVREKHIWEDLMIALLLKKSRIFPKSISNLVVGDK